MRNENIAIYIATHKDKIDDASSGFVPLQVGAANAASHFEQICDDEGDNISGKNRNYCELTGLYWIWKNSTASIVGLEHYRRRFDIKTHQIEGILNDYDIIIPPEYQYRISLTEEYRRYHISKDWDNMLDILKRRYPEYRTEVFDANRLVPYNMFVSRKAVCDEYCQWLFDILAELEERHIRMEGDEYQERYLGFLSERLFTLYIKQNKLKAYTCKVRNPEQDSVFYCCKNWVGQHMVNPLFFKIGHRQDAL